MLKALAHPARLWMVERLEGFLACFWLPVGHARFDVAVLESLRLVRWYAHKHVLLCLVPAFLYSGPAINVLAIVLTARVLGVELGVALTLGALMHLLFLKEEREKAAQAGDVYIEADDRPPRALWQTALHFFAMSAILVFANWARPADSAGVWHVVFAANLPAFRVTTIGSS